MKKAIVPVLLILFASPVLGQSQIGLVCTSENESIPRLLKVNLVLKSINFFDFGTAMWVPLSQVEVTDSAISAQRVSSVSRMFQNQFSINRLDGSWESQTESSFLNSRNVPRSNGVCVSRTWGEMDAISRQQLEQLNQRRAF